MKAGHGNAIVIHCPETQRREPHDFSLEGTSEGNLEDTAFVLWLEEESRDEPVIGNANSYGERINNDSFTTREKLMMVIPLQPLPPINLGYHERISPCNGQYVIAIIIIRDARSEAGNEHRSLEQGFLWVQLEQTKKAPYKCPIGTHNISVLT
uniref:Uncharacterized protein n=1 Tax=Octactis speculum TaxID=3111310 RepID=A0A7S2HML0_9STRA|mmetsp:Transcript_7711/g.9619  ORF Transcript_7711/g.9619 Transcript_7711/m.9619 type:complete len:153 (+) Transcript_7711:522-980(+)